MRTTSLTALLFMTLASTALATAAQNEPAPNRPPNVVLILIDDLSHYGVSCYGADRIRSIRGWFPDQQVSTPNIDRLAAEGLRCDHAFVHPLCENTRVSLMTGLCNSRNFVIPRALHASAITFGDVFARAGYATGLFGKWKQSHGTPSVPAKHYLAEFGWRRSVAFDVETMGNRFINPNLVIDGVVTNYMGRKDVDPMTGRRWYGPDIVNRAALEFIESHKDEPFFVYYPMMLVHDEHQPTPATKPRSLYDEFDLEMVGLNRMVGDDPKYISDMIVYADRLIGRVIDKLDDLGLREETLVVVLADNGTKEVFSHVFPDGRVYPGRKGGNADNGLHVPLILSQPGVVPNSSTDNLRTYDGLIDVTDIFPTLVEATGVELPSSVRPDGKSFWPQVMGGAGTARDEIYRWYIGNSRDEKEVIRFAFDHHFKRYAPSYRFPAGRFYDLRTDLFERAGDVEKELRWGVIRTNGLDVESLDDQQRAAYDRLGKILDANEYVPVAGIEIAATNATIRAGEQLTLEAIVSPAEATRRGVVWESSNPAVARVNKFGELQAVSPGEVQITAYSWDDAAPLANGKAPEYRRDGLQATIKVRVL